MKSVKLTALFAFAICLLSFSPNPQPVLMSTYSTAGGGIQWKNETIELGDIAQGKPVTINFEFTNGGATPIIITNVQAGCGCTVAEYPKGPVGAGKTEKITATFNAAAKGLFSKTVTVFIENEEPKVLTFKGTVV